jgi:hypothetical protein
MRRDVTRVNEKQKNNDENETDSEDQDSKAVPVWPHEP